jgi:NTP pyrophosphatase (non-canonical NTP hydrolase)
MNSLESLIEQVHAIADRAGYLFGSDPKTQALKFFSEAGEMADNIAKGRDCRDDIGDILVTLIVQAHYQGTNLTECLQIAVNEIAPRKGTMINGTFVKDE